MTCRTHHILTSVLACGALSLAAAAPAAGEAITVLNPSFEQPALGLCEFGGENVGWTSVGGYGVWHTGTAGECFFDAYPNGVPDGVQTSFINVSGGSIVQVLDEVLAPNTKYTLSVAVGRRDDHIIMQDYKIELLAGMQIIAEDLGTLDPAPGTFEVSTICATTGASHPQLGQKLAIRLYLMQGIQANFDDVHLEKSAPGGDCVAISGTPGDINGDGDVNGADLGLLLSAWGACGDCSPGSCPADLNGDCTVDGADLGLLLGNWG